VPTTLTPTFAPSLTMAWQSKQTVFSGSGDVGTVFYGALDGDGSTLAVTTPQVGEGKGWGVIQAWCSSCWGALEGYSKDTMYVEGGVATMGLSVALSADGSVGAFLGDVVRVYLKQPTGTWVQRGSTLSAGEDYGKGNAGYLAVADYFRDVALSEDGNTVAFFHTDESELRVYDWGFGATGSWSWAARPPIGRAKGVSMTMSGDGKVLFDCDWQSQSKPAKVHSRVWTSTGWVDRTYIKEFFYSSKDLFGLTLRTNYDGSRVAVAAKEQSWGNGMVRVYDWDTPSAPGEYKFLKYFTGGKYFGQGVDLSSDGNTLAMLSRHDGTDQYPSGYIYVYDYDSATGQWNLRGDKFKTTAWLGTGGYYAHPAMRISLSRDGSHVALSLLRGKVESGAEGALEVFEWKLA
jgi:hypothetical protein